jgi:hypothetical protein
MTNTSLANELGLFDEAGLAHALRVTLVAILGSALAISAMTLFLRWHQIPQLALLVAAASLVALGLSHSGRTKPALLFVLLGIIYVVMHAAARASGIENIGLAILPVLIVVTGLLLDRLTIVIFTATAIVATSGMLAIRYFVLRAERYSANDMGDLFIFTLTCATAALVARLFAQRIQEDLKRAAPLGLHRPNMRQAVSSNDLPFLRNGRFPSTRRRKVQLPDAPVIQALTATRQRGLSAEQRIRVLCRSVLVSLRRSASPPINHCDRTGYNRSTIVVVPKSLRLRWRRVPESASQSITRT